jgi:uncharacterized protein YjiS (DUF1127 family)
MRKPHILSIREIGWAIRVVSRGGAGHRWRPIPPIWRTAMSAITSFAKSFPPPATPSKVSAIAVAVTASFKRLARAYRNRADAAALARFDDRMLADMGLSRSDVRDAFAGPVWEDPTSLLRARALERRLSRHHVSLGLEEAPLKAPPLVPEGHYPPVGRPARFTV